MSIGNLHNIVRGAINAVSPDQLIPWLVSTGSTVAAGGKATPTYAAPVTVGAQIQPVRGGDLRKYAFLQGQGIFRAVYLFGNVQGIVRVDAKGGDLLQFPIVPEDTNVRTWLVRAVDETWGFNGGWCRVIVSQQLDPNNPQTQQQ